MATEFKLPYTANEINEKLGKIDNISWNNLPDKPFGTETEKEEAVFAEKTLSFSLNSDFGAYASLVNPASFVFTDNKDYIITWDGKTDTRTAFSFSVADGSSCIAVGNPVVAGLTPNEDAFAIVCDTTNNYLWFFSLESIASHTVAIHQNVIEVQALDVKYLPKALQFGEEGGAGEHEIFNGENLPFGSAEVDNMYKWETYPAEFSFVEGNRYMIVWDDTGYFCNAVPINIDEVNIVAVGNLAYIGLGDDTGEPFLIGITSGYAYCYTLDNKETHNIVIYDINPSIKTLDAKYLPMDAIDARIDAYISEALGGDY
jgi:hypothetical protein